MLSVNDVIKRVLHRTESKAKRSRIRREDPSADITFINEGNKRFNEKIARLVPKIFGYVDHLTSLACMANTQKKSRKASNAVPHYKICIFILCFAVETCAHCLTNGCTLRMSYWVVNYWHCSCLKRRPFDKYQDLWHLFPPEVRELSFCWYKLYKFGGPTVSRLSCPSMMRQT